MEKGDDISTVTHMDVQGFQLLSDDALRHNPNQVLHQK